MDKKPGKLTDRQWLFWSGLYAAIIFVLACIGNYLLPYSPGPDKSPALWMYLLWGSLYLPVIVLPLTARWKVTEFGFTLSPPPCGGEPAGHGFMRVDDGLRPG